MKKINKNTGITLIALVVTIIVLLILAGVSISMLTGQNGILNRATEAVNKTKNASTTEKIHMAIASYNIEKAMDSNLSFKDFCEKEDQDLGDIKIIEENPSNEIQFIAKVDGRILVMKKDGSYVWTKSENLVNNGFAENGNKNFEDWEFKNGSFSMTSSSDRQGAVTTDFIEVNTNKRYYQSMMAKTNNKKSVYYAGIIEYDIDRKEITASNYLYKENSLTYLEKDLKNGDTEIYVNDLTGFNIENLKGGINSGLIFWNYKDSTGYEYPELTYSRNVYFDLLDGENNFDLKENKIILNEPWKYGTVEKGVKLSQSSATATYNYGLLSEVNMTNEYKYYENYIEGTVNSGPIYDASKFRPATKYVKILMLINYNKLPDVTTDIKDVIFAEME